MCVILFAIDQHRDFPLVVTANRDEFYHRPTMPMHWWPQQNLLAGRDDASGGTWLAVADDGMVTAVTNVRESGVEAGQRTRGELPLLARSRTTTDLRQQLIDSASEYAGFNLIRLNSREGWYFSNRDAHPGRHLHRGAYGLSNHLLQSPWPKVVRLRDDLVRTLAGSRRDDTEQLHAALLLQLQDGTPAPDHLLPDTGVGLDFERFLSSPFIRSDDYGTRASTVVTVARDGEITVTEQGWGPQGQRRQWQRFRWQAGTGSARP